MARQQELRLRVTWKSNDDSFWIELNDGLPVPLGQAPRANGQAQFTREDLRRMNRHVRSTLDKLANSLSSELSLSPDDEQYALQELAAIGRDMFTRIFSNELQATLTRFLAAHPLATITITADEFIIPWELLYISSADPDDGPDDGSGALEYNQFLGYRFFVRRIVRYAYDQSLADPEIYINPTPLLGLFANNELRHVALEVQILNHLQASGLAEVLAFDCSEGDRKELVRSKLRPFLDQEFHLIHFACHCEPGAEGLPEDHTCLVLSNGFCIYFYDFRHHHLRLKNAPLVFANACRTNMQDPSQTCNTVMSLLRYGARGVIVTEAVVPDELAAHYAGEFYRHFLNGQTLGEALLQARHTLIAQHRNPLGLLYAAYADGSTRFLTLD